jgi:ATP-dependent DNA helicase 2 subunit 2
LILFGTADTANELASADDPTAYCNVTVARPLGPVDWELLKYVENELKPGDTPADCILLFFMVIFF